MVVCEKKKRKKESLPGGEGFEDILPLIILENSEQRSLDMDNFLRLIHTTIDKAFSDSVNDPFLSITGGNLSEKKT